MRDLFRGFLYVLYYAPFAVCQPFGVFGFDLLCLTFLEADDYLSFQSAEDQERCREIGDDLLHRRDVGPLAIAQQPSIVNVSFEDNRVETEESFV